MKANFYHYRQCDGDGVIDKIFTNNYENLGNEPVLITDNEQLPMIFDGKYYSANLKYPTKQYKIYYKDTDKYENSGNPVFLDKHKISRNILVKDLKNCGKPLQKDISKGFAEGKVVTDINNIPNGEPIILITGDVGDGESLMELPSNVCAVIVSDGIIDYLSHVSALSRAYFNLFTILYDENKYNELKNLEGQYIHISNVDGNLKYKTIQKLPLSKVQNNVNIPTLTFSDNFLKYNELSKLNAGLKAYRIANLQKLKEQGVLKDVIIPKGFFVSSYYVDKIENFLNRSNTAEERESKLFRNPFLEELDKMCKNVGIDSACSIVRSAFNAEDLREYPTAGLYKSECCYSSDDLVFVIDNIYESKNSPKAQESRKRYNIPDSVLQPSVLIQEYIQADYNFTAYSDLENNKVLIEISALKYAHLKLNPATILYDDKNKNFKIIEHQIYNNKFLVDDNGNILEKEDGNNEILENWHVLLSPLTILSQNVLKLEKYFGKPQDIEGGIQDNKVYLWQVRDVITKR